MNIIKELSIGVIMFIILCGCETKQNTPRISPVGFENTIFKGELNTRITKNYNRLEESRYQPESVFLTDEQSGNWPGDTEGRTILGLILDAQSSHRDPRYLQKIIELIPAHLNEKGYMGKVYQNLMDEQQLSGNGWMLRGLCEYYAWKKDGRVLSVIQSIVNNLFIPGKGYYASYPIAPEQRIKGVGDKSGSIQNTINNWQLSSDIGCVFIGMEGAIHAYQYVPSQELKDVIEEMINRFLKMDPITIQAQTHAFLTGCRGLIRYSELTHDESYVHEVVKRWDLYRNYGMTENYANYNWFRRYDTWTEPCAIVDSYLLSTQLWMHTQDINYLHDAERIYYNALCFAQRYNGGFGCDNCPGIHSKEDVLKVRADEAYWCCTMRGGEGLSCVAKYAAFKGNNRIHYFTSYHAGIYKMDDLSIEVKTDYPFSDIVNFRVKGASDKKQKIRFVIPSGVNNTTIKINGKAYPFEEEKGFICFEDRLKENDEIEISFAREIQRVSTLNKENTNQKQIKISYGPLLFGYSGEENIDLKTTDQVRYSGNKTIEINDGKYVLTPIYHLCDSNILSGSGYKHQILFEEL